MTKKRFTFADAKAKIKELEGKLAAIETNDNVFTNAEVKKIKALRTWKWVGPLVFFLFGFFGGHNTYVLDIDCEAHCEKNGIEMVSPMEMKKDMEHMMDKEMDMMEDKMEMKMDSMIDEMEMELKK